MKKIAFFDTKPYDKKYFDEANNGYFDIKYYEEKLNPDTAGMTKKYDGAVAFVNDVINKEAIEGLYESGVRVLAMRCSGYNNIDFKTAYGKINILRVPGYSPYAVAEHAMALVLCLNRKIHRAFNRTREYNFSLNGLEGFDLYGKTVGVIGTGKIGSVFAKICSGFGMTVLGYDKNKRDSDYINYVELDELFEKSDIISLHCPLTDETDSIINAESISKMKKGVYIINTSRGALIDSDALLQALREEKIGAAGLDVYEEESELFFEDFSNTIVKDKVLSLLISMPNVIITSHQAFLTDEALHNIAKTTIDNLKAFFNNDVLENEICYNCIKYGSCKKEENRLKRCF